MSNVGTGKPGAQPNPPGGQKPSSSQNPAGAQKPTSTQNPYGIGSTNPPTPTVNRDVEDQTKGGRYEGTTTRMIEDQTSRVPSTGYLGLALGSMALSWLFLARNNKGVANFVGQWVPTLLIVGMYNKLVKLEREFSDYTR